MRWQLRPFTPGKNFVRFRGRPTHWLRYGDLHYHRLNELRIMYLTGSDFEFKGQA